MSTTLLRALKSIEKKSRRRRIKMNIDETIYIEVKRMKRTLNDELVYEILSVVEEIPEGKVATYGQIATMIGRERNSRLVGRVLSMSEFYGSYPCHRVVNHEGRLVPGWKEQRYLLENEGVPMKNETHVDINVCRWNE